MNLTLILEVLLALFKFPSELGAFVNLLSKSPEEKRQAIMQQVDAWMNESQSSDRPKWNQ